MSVAQPTGPSINVSVAAILLFEAAALLAKSRVELELLDSGAGAVLARNLGYLVVSAILLPLLAPYLAQARVPLLALLRPRDLTLRLVLAATALGLLLRLLRWAALTLLLGYGLIGNGSEGPVGPLIGFDCPRAGLLLSSFAVMALLVPLTEEIVNRGLILHSLLARGRLPAIAISAALFAVTHPPSAWALTFAAGLAFAVQALNFRTLWAPVTAHAAYNAAAVVDWECFRIVWNPAPGDPTLGTLMLLSAIILGAGMIGVCGLTSRRAAGVEPTAGSPAAPATARSPPSR